MEGSECEIFVMLSVDDSPLEEAREEVNRTRRQLERVTSERDTWLDAATRLHQEHVRDQRALQHYRTVLSAVTEQAREDTERLERELENTRRRLREVAKLLDEPSEVRLAKVVARDRLFKK